MYKRLIFTLLFLLGLPAHAVSRVYFHMEPQISTLFPSLVSADAGWEETNERRTGHLSTVKHNTTGTTAIGQTVDITEDTANQEVDQEFISAPLAVGTVFTSGVTTVTSQIPMRELNATDDVTMCILGIRVVNSDASSVQATILTVANYGTTTEYNGTARNKTCANADTLTGSYTSVSGDRLLIAVGHQTDGAETTPQAVATWAADSAGADCTAGDETETACYAWLEFSNTFTFEEDTEVVPTTLASGANATDLNSYSTVSISPTANRLVILIVGNTHGTTATLPTVTGASMTWAQESTVLSADSLTRLTAFRCESGSPGSGALTVDFGGVTQTNFYYIVTQFEGTEDDVGSNGSGAIVQSVTNTASATSLTVTLAALGSSKNGVFGTIEHATNEVQSVEAGHENVGFRASLLGRTYSVFTYNDTTVANTWTTSSQAAGIAIEIKRDTAEASRNRVIMIHSGGE